MKNWFPLLCFMLVSMACEKAVQSHITSPPQVLTRQVPDAKPFASKWMPAELIEQFNWMQQVPLYKKDTLIGIKVLLNDLAGSQLQYLVVHYKSNAFTEVVLHRIQYEGLIGKSTPLSITSKNFNKNITAKAGIFYYDTTRTNVPNRGSTVKKSQPYNPFFTASSLYGSLGNEYFTTRTYTLINGAFLSAGGSGTGGGENGENPFNPYTDLDYLDPLTPPVAGGSDPYAILDAATNSIFRDRIYNIEDYPGKDLGFPFRYWETPSTSAEESALQALEEEFAPYIESPCHGTARWGGGPNWNGTVEHITIQFYYMCLHPFEGTREYAIPNANETGTSTGYADIANSSTGEIFEIKSTTPSEIAKGEAEAARYVSKANENCSPSSGVAYRKGTNFTSVVLPNLKNPGKGLKATLEKDGVIVYETVDALPQIAPLPIPQSTSEKLRDFIKLLVKNYDIMDVLIKEFLRQNPSLIVPIKTTIASAGIAIAVYTLVEDVLSGGVGVADTYPHLKAAYSLFTFAMAL